MYLCSRDFAILQGSLWISTGVLQDAGLELVPPYWFFLLVGRVMRPKLKKKKKPSEPGKQVSE